MLEAVDSNPILSCQDKDLVAGILTVVKKILNVESSL